MMDILPKMLMKNGAHLDISQKPYIDPDYRKFDRFMICKVVYVLISWPLYKDRFSLGQLVDINKEGCGISYIMGRSTAGTLRSLKTCNLKFISEFKIYELDQNTALYDIELIEYSTNIISVRRCGIKFGEFVKVEHRR
jgi:hypothetical protein